MKRIGQVDRRGAELTLCLAAAFLLGACAATDASRAARARSPGQSDPVGEREKASARQAPYVLVGAGDIAGCVSIEGAAATAKLVQQIPGEVFAAGDLAYEKGTAQEFRDCYGTTWGRFKGRTWPAPGNHEYYSGNGEAYFSYWGARAGSPAKSYYSFDRGRWHVIALNTNCLAPGVGGCGLGSEQEKWLRRDLAEHKGSCIVAYGHHALFSSGIIRKHAVHPELAALWRDLYAARADLILAGHEHSYERFLPQDPDGRPDPSNGIREIVVGTGGRSHDPLGMPLPNSAVRNADTFGVLKLTLWPDRYRWEFLPVNGAEGFHDSGEASCHNAAAKAAAKAPAEP